MNSLAYIGIVVFAVAGINLWLTLRRHGARRMMRVLSAGVLLFFVFPVLTVFIGAATAWPLAVALLVVWTLPLNYVREHGFEGLGFNAKTFQSFRRDAFWFVVMTPVALLLIFIYQEVIAALKSAN